MEIILTHTGEILSTMVILRLVLVSDMEDTLILVVFTIDIMIHSIAISGMADITEALGAVTTAHTTMDLLHFILHTGTIQVYDLTMVRIQWNTAEGKDKALPLQDGIQLHLRDQHEEIHFCQQEAVQMM